MKPLIQILLIPTLFLSMSATEGFSYADPAAHEGAAPHPHETLIPVLDDDSRVPPKFAKLGQMYQVGSVVWSGVVLRTLKKMIFPKSLNLAKQMTQPQADRLCKSLGNTKKNSRLETRLPTQEEAEALGRAMGAPDHYNHRLIPQMFLHTLWTSTIDSDFTSSVSVFVGAIGEIGEFYLNDYLETRCVITVH